VTATSLSSCLLLAVECSLLNKITDDDDDKSKQGNRRHQTSPPVLPPGELLSTLRA